VFIRHEDGRNMPCDARELNVWLPADESWSVGRHDAEAVQVMTEGGQLVYGLRSRPVLPARPVGGYTPHWTTCPGSKGFRKGRR